MGEVRVPAAALCQAQTQRAVENFPISGVPIEPALIRALGLIKGAAAQVNAELGVLDAGHGRRDRQGRRRGRRRRARRRVPDRRVPDRLRHVEQHERQRGDRHARQPACSASRSTRTTTSTPRSRATTCSRPPSTSRRPSSLISDLIPALEHLEQVAERARPTEFAEVVKTGRTHLMDATPVTLGQEFGGYAAQIRYGIERLRGGAAAARRAAARRHRGRHRHQHPARLRRVGDLDHRRADRACR